MGKETIHTDNAPSAIGAYSQAVVAGEYLFTAGQIGLDPATGALVGDDVVTQTEQVLKNLSAILEAADISFNDAIKATIYLADMADFPLVNDIYKTRFSAENPPSQIDRPGGRFTSWRQDRNRYGRLRRRSKHPEIDHTC